MNPRTQRVWPLLAVALLVACTGQPTQPTGTWDPASRLAGRWEWVWAQDVVSGTVSSPETAGFTAELEFVRTSPSTGTFRFVRNPADTVLGTFDIGSEDSPGNDFILIEPSIAFVQRAAWLAVGSDSLRLLGVFESGTNSTWSRMR